VVEHEGAIGGTLTPLLPRYTQEHGTSKEGRLACLTRNRHTHRPLRRQRDSACHLICMVMEVTYTHAQCDVDTVDLTDLK
jgi:hypothetical protein